MWKSNVLYFHLPIFFEKGNLRALAIFLFLDDGIKRTVNINSPASYAHICTVLHTRIRINRKRPYQARNLWGKAACYTHAWACLSILNSFVLCHCSVVIDECLHRLRAYFELDFKRKNKEKKEEEGHKKKERKPLFCVCVEEDVCTESYSRSHRREERRRKPVR